MLDVEEKTCFTDLSIILFILQYPAMFIPIVVRVFYSNKPEKIFLLTVRDPAYPSLAILILVVASYLFVLGLGKKENVLHELSMILSLQGTLTAILYYLSCLAISGDLLRSVSLMTSGLSPILIPVIQITSSFLINPNFLAGISIKKSRKNLIILVPLTAPLLYYVLASSFGQNAYINAFSVVYFLFTVILIIKLLK
ncbi:hypothetical protein DRN86_02360 [Candidatus Geothermarchaeota archaeon]|nr:MAG: hypothetical protein DRN86_02360 [Candidatus Geothermarchaeota archaeon]